MSDNCHRMLNPVEAIIMQFKWDKVKPKSVYFVNTNIHAIQCDHGGLRMPPTILYLIGVIYFGKNLGSAGRCPVCGQVFYKPSKLARERMQELEESAATEEGK
jgi:hypothetical protein